MRVIMGLGNPGSTYHRTRHNIGKIFVDMLVKQLNASEVKRSPKFTAYKFKDTILANSQVYMNLSAQAVEGVMKSFPEAKIEHYVFSIDDLEHRPGFVRLKKTGSAEGHRGILSIMNKFKTKDVNRLQLGIGRPESREPDVISNYVLSAMPKQEMQLLKDSYQKAFSLLKLQGFV